MNITTRPLTQDEAVRLLSSTPSPWTHIFSFSIRTGLRLGDIIRLRISDIGPSSISIIEEKTGKPKTIKLTDPIRNDIAFFRNPKNREALGMYYEKRPDHVFPYGDPSTYRKALIRYCILAMIDLDRVSFHSLRKTAATIIFNELGISHASQFLGHSRVSTTMRYIEIDQVEISSIMDIHLHIGGTQ